MNILIIADALLMKELHQNGIIDFICFKKKALVETANRFPDFPHAYDTVIIWTHPKDLADYSHDKESIPSSTALIEVRFPKEIHYREMRVKETTSWGLVTTYKENPDFHAPSKYFRALQFQLKEVLKKMQ